AGTSGLTWVIDPIDGTRSFIAGLPTWGVLIALDDGHATRLGIVDQPYIGERFGARLGPSGDEAWLARGGARRALRVRPCATLGAAVLLSTAPGMFAPPEFEGFSAVSRRCRLTRYGTDCYGYAMVAAGHADLVIEAGLEAYDIAAPGALVRAAGGIVTDWQGGDCRWGGRAIAAGDPRVHAEALEVLSRI
ncbi:MAG TPA: inositol monophosphatase family protein, partial [Thermohalobaculum sp.]|nr:inositol monophosphatase family protein [Thermohalobaculum sp.]